MRRRRTGRLLHAGTFVRLPAPETLHGRGLSGLATVDRIAAALCLFLTLDTCNLPTDRDWQLEPVAAPQFAYLSMPDLAEAGAGSCCCRVNSDHAEINSAAMSGPMTKPLSPKSEIPPTVEMRTT